MHLRTMQHRAISFGAILLMLAVALGAFGAHALKARLTPDALSQWKTAVEYQFYHGMGMLLVALLADRIGSRTMTRVTWCFLLGTMLFSGSLYLLSTRELSGLRGIEAFIGPVTPIGGVLWLLGWLQLALSTWRRTDHR